MQIDKSNIDQFINGPVMNCSNSGVTEIKFIPESITTLICYNNQLTLLPPLPDGLIELFCEMNQLTELPLLPNSLKYLYCQYNKLTSLPLLPDLDYLYYFNNPLINKPTGLLSNWIKQHNKSINRSNQLKKLLDK